MKSVLFNSLLALILLAPNAQADALAPLNINALYNFTFAGLPFGQMGVAIKQDQAGYAATVDITSTGVINLFIRHSSHSTVQDSATGRVYETHYQTKKKPKYVKLTYKNGALTEETALPPDALGKRPAVPQALKNTAYDPLSFILAMRAALHDAMARQKDSFRLNVYDGRRLTQADFTIQGTKNITWNGTKQPVIVVAVRRRQLGGFTEQETADFNPNEPSPQLYFTADDRLIPIITTVTVFLSPVSATLSKECADAQSCLLGNKE